jgi:hypothetical protein
VPSHFSTLGFQIEREQDFVSLAEQVAAEAESIKVKDGTYLRWTGAGGEELWLQLNAQDEVVGMHPHFSGPSRIKARVTGRVRRADDTDLDGAFHAWAAPNDDSVEHGVYPFVFDVPDACVYSDFDVPGIALAQVAAFAHELSFFESEAAFQASQASAELKFGSKSFIPSGLFDDGDGGEPQAHAMFTGEVVEAATRLNRISGRSFYWALVETLGGRYDVVIDKSLLAAQPVAGGVLSGTFWLSGRLISYPRRKKNWVGKLLDGDA